MKLVSSVVAESHTPLYTYRGNQKDRYSPELSEEEMYTRAGETPRPVIRAAYMEPIFRLYRGHLQKFTGYFANWRNSLYLLPHKKPHRGTGFTVGNHGGRIAVGIKMDTSDTSQKDVLYGGMQISHQYTFHWGHGLPPLAGLTFEVSSHAPYYKNKGGNHGGDVSMVLVLTTKDGKQGADMVVRLFSLNPKQSITSEKIVGFDPNSNRLHITQSVGPVRRYITADTASDISGTSRGEGLLGNPPTAFNKFFKFSVTEDNIQALLEDASEFLGDVQPVQNWMLKGAVMQYEIHQSGIGAVMAGGHCGFEISRG